MILERMPLFFQPRYFIFYWCPVKILTISVSFNYTMDCLCFYEHGLIAVKRQNNLSTATRR